MQIKIEKIIIENFKGTECLEFSAGGGSDMVISGGNGSGKTTILDAFNWCLFGKDSQDQADFSIKPLDQAGVPAHNLNHSVKLVLSVDDSLVALSRVFCEKYTKKRGQASKELTGHETTFFVDGVPTKKREYEETVSKIIDENLLRLVTDARYFNEKLHWQKRREILFEICGTLTDMDIIDSDPGLSALPGMLGKHTLDNYKKIVIEKRKMVNDELEKIPIRIDEVKKKMTSIDADEKGIRWQIETLKTAKKAAEKKLADLENGGEMAILGNRLAEIETDILREGNDYEKSRQRKISKINNEINDVSGRLTELRGNMSAARLNMNEIQATIDQCEQLLAGLRKTWGVTNSKEFETPGPCPHCGAQPEHQEKTTIEAFNLKKAEELKNISEMGKAEKKRLDKCQSDLAFVKKNHTDFDIAVKEITETIENLRSVKRIIEAEHPPESRHTTAVVQAEIKRYQAGQSGAIENAQSELTQIEAQLAATQNALNTIESNQKAENRIEELSADEKRLSHEFTRLEGELFLIEKFIRAKVAMVESSINDKFERVRFRLFEEQINGGIKEICETTLDGVPYSSLNNAGDIHAGIDIIRALQRHHGVFAPVWVDNAESINEIPKTPAQAIHLVVTKGDLKIEKI